MKEITINQSSIFAKLYKFIYRTELPRGLCNFFWANLIALIFVIPLTIFWIPSIIAGLLENRKNDKPFLKHWVFDWDAEFWSLVGVNVLGWLVVTFTFSYGHSIYYMVTMCHYWGENTAVFWIVNVVFLVIGIYYLFSEIIKPWYKRHNKERDLKRAEVWYLSLNKGEITDDYRSNWLLNDYYRRGRYEGKTPTTRWITVVWTAIKGFYDKNCPVITWK